MNLKGFFLRSLARVLRTGTVVSVTALKSLEGVSAGWELCRMRVVTAESGMKQSWRMCLQKTGHFCAALWAAGGR